MANPHDDLYSVPSGRKIHAGRHAPSSSGAIASVQARDVASLAGIVSGVRSGTISQTQARNVAALAGNLFANAVALSGPTSGAVNAAATFTVTASGEPSASVVVTPSATGLAGAFSPTSVTLNAVSPSATFTFTPTASGTASISIANNGGLANLGIPITFVTSSAVAGVPAWMTAQVGQWAQISGTTANDSTGNYSGVGWRDDANRLEIGMALAGGHTAGQWLTDNRVMTLRLDVDAPAWVQRRGPSDATGWDTTGVTQPYFPSDGRPVPRHTYSAATWWPERNCYVFGGLFSGSGASGTIPKYNGFVPSGDTGGDWEQFGDSPYQTTPSGELLAGTRDSRTGHLYATGKDNRMQGYRLNRSTLLWEVWHNTTDPVPGVGGGAFDTKRNLVYQLLSNSWFVNGAIVRSLTIDPATGAKTAITFNASAAATALNADVLSAYSPWTVYDEDADCFYWHGELNTADRRTIYKITPNSGTAWDVDVLPFSGVTPPITGNASGLMNRLHYAPRWRALLELWPSQAIYYYRLPFSSSLTVRSGATTGTLPYTATVLPLRGELPSGYTVTSADDTTLKATVLSTHDDGSAAVVVVAGETSVSANTTKRLSLGIAAAGADTALTAARIGALVTNVTVNFSGTYGSASLTSFGSPERVWWANSRVICARYRLAAPTPGSTALEAVIDITAYPSPHNRALVEVVIENGKIDALNSSYAVKPASATYSAATVSVNGSTAITVSTASVFSGVTTHEPFRAWYGKAWVGGDPGLRTTQRVRDLQRHPLFWRMDDCTTDFSTYTGDKSTTYGTDAYAPWGTGRHRAVGMAGGAVDETIGPLTKWDAYAIQSGDYRAWNASEQNALAFLSYDCNYRDSATGLIPDSARMPNKQRQGGGQNWPETAAYTDAAYAMVDRAHHPAVGLVAFVSRPSPVFIELAQKVAVFCATDSSQSSILTNNFPAATVGVTDVTGMNYASQIRSFAWGVRSVMHATFLSADSSTWRSGGKVWLGRSARYAYSFKLDGYQEALRWMWYDGPTQKTTDGATNYDDAGNTPWPGSQDAQWTQSFVIGEIHKLSNLGLLTGADKTTYLEPFVDWLLEQPARWVNDQSNGGWRFARDRMTYRKATGAAPTSYADAMAYDISGAPSSVSGGWGYLSGVNQPTWALTEAGGFEPTARASYPSQLWYALVAAVERDVPGARTAWQTVTGITAANVHGTPGLTSLATWRTGFGSEPRWSAWPRNLGS